ncbi:heat shock protein HtpX [Alkalihalobacillus alcalophilus ATCC 27647 = CGMCC 1.3604]|uniref:Protease HtpX homolog n=1 Tax=Alkalihalobacillus alcalophilus ATCC 27647 = CGMCC 1.3604 TaxID=1218173 RepID=A0A094XGX7_ALKAL|nr:zinc metalloprotease HtpX [Alkalihalobacillus alcalophilus]KGA98045.1 heat shock protein HtpX [Alkalihalobacillus alcalophilus ATCC 27647 = CGMCC 1.3604]MED1561895.1 zinc metalloprotease HtpX [Alkalihalobacillus alcalophilus]THG89578.1 heat shock protein HtpX [Alkalihalobacillus alcalophilus ATCC 27647 = CGMCC 1.3604]
MVLYKQIERNKRHTVIIVTGFILFVLAVGAAFSYIRMGDYYSGMAIAAIIGGGYTLIMLLSSTNVVMKMNHAREIKSAQDNPFLWNTVEGLALAARVPTPKVYIINDSSPNAFATGTSPKKGAVAVTTGLLDRLNREEIEGVVAHEIAHIRNYDIRLATIAIALVSVVAILSDLGSRMLYYSGRSRRDNNNQSPIIFIIAFVLLIFAPIIATLIRLAISRNREFLADASAAELTRNPHALASALRKITTVDTPVKEASSTSAPLYFSDPLKKKAKNLFSTHPAPDERIKRLQQM